MKRILSLASLSLLIAATAWAQEGDNTVSVDESAPFVPANETTPMAAPVARRDQLPELNPGQMTPEMYLYLQEQRRHDDPKQAIRRKAEARGAARETRIAAMKWYGMSNARPQANPVPFMGTYSPTWVGAGLDRHDWYGLGWPSVTLRIDQDYERR